MRRGAWVLMIWYALGLGACSGGYPLPPTRCDDFCDVTKGIQCATYYDPASCVSQCEQADFDADTCGGEFDAVVTCFRKTPSALQQLCNYNAQPNACGSQTQALTECATYVLASRQR